MLSLFVFPQSSELRHRLQDLKCAYMLILMRALGTLTASQHNIFDSEKLSQILLVLLMGFEPQVFGSRV